MKAHMISENTISIFYNEEFYTMGSDDAGFDRIADLLRHGDYEAAIAEIDKVTKLTNHFGDKLQVTHDRLTINGTPIPDCLAERLETMRNEGYPIEPMEKFIGNLMNNPANHAITELLGFLEYSDLPITDDGHFLAYKRVNDDYTDVHSGKINNAVGQVVSMPRWEVDDDRYNTCSHGLHFASLDYLTNFAGPRLMLLKINPADVVSIPADYDNSKGRCCRYEVIKELPMPSHFSLLEGSWESVYLTEENDE